MTPSKSMPQKSNHDFKEKYPYVQVGKFLSMWGSVLEYETDT